MMGNDYPPYPCRIHGMTEMVRGFCAACRLKYIEDINSKTPPSVDGANHDTNNQ